LPLFSENGYRPTVLVRPANDPYSPRPAVHQRRIGLEAQPLLAMRASFTDARRRKIVCGANEDCGILIVN
jgi:hypothetical protein